MRLCRFQVHGEEEPLVGYYDETSVVAVDQACEIYCQTMGVELLMARVEDLLDLLPPDGISHHAARLLGEWLDALPANERAELATPLDQVALLTPIPDPPKLLLLAGNYPKHVAERGGSVAERERTFPYVFMKPPTTTLNHPHDPILLPTVSPDHIDWECELGVVIGRVARHVEESEALDYVAGYTVINDVSDRKFQPNPDRTERPRDAFFDWLHGKWHDGSCPVGPCVLSADAVPDPQRFRLRLSVNGDVKQDAETSQMIFPVAAIIAFLSKFVTLEPGDIIATGTPAGVGAASETYLRSGDHVEATIDGIGCLTNPVMHEHEWDSLEEDNEIGAA